MNKKNIHPYVQELSNEALIEAIDSLKNPTWNDNAVLRKIATAVFGNDMVMEMIACAVPLAMELSCRVKEKSI